MPATTSPVTTHVGGRDARVDARRPRLVGERVGQRRPRELEAAHRDDHGGRELHRDGVEAGGAGLLGAQQVRAVDDVQREDGGVGRDRRRAEAQQRAAGAPRRARHEREVAAQRDTQRPTSTTAEAA